MSSVAVALSPHARPGSGTVVAPEPPSNPSSPRQEVIEAIHRWVALTGSPPAGMDWDPSRARATGQEGRAARFEQGGFPNAATVRRRFGSWNAAIRAAGYDPHPAPARGGPHRGPEGVLAALRRWHALYGAPPTMADWEPSRARRLGQPWRAERYAAGDWPSIQTVRYNFDTLNAAIKAAGLPPAPGGRRSAAARTVQREAWTRRASGSSSRDAAAVAQAVRSVASARGRRDIAGTRSALIDLGVAALSWAESLPAHGPPTA